MIKILLLVLCLNIGGPLNIVHAQEENPQEMVSTYFQAVKNGDIQTMKSHMGEKFYQRRKVLLERNKNYPEFLKSFYERGEILVGEVKDGVVTVEIQFPDGSINYHHLVVKKDSLGQWKIVDELRKNE